MRTEAYQSKDTTQGRICGLIFILLLCLFGAACSAQLVITEDFSEYKASPSSILSQNSQNNHSESVSTESRPATPNQEVSPQNINPAQSEAKAEFKRTGRTLLSLFVGIIATAIIVQSTTLSNAITAD